MPPGTPIALTTLRVPHGQPQPSEEVFRQAIEHDRALLKIVPANGLLDIAVAGPYHITDKGQDLDEYVVWER